MRWICRLSNGEKVEIKGRVNAIHRFMNEFIGSNRTLCEPIGLEEKLEGIKQEYINRMEYKRKLLEEEQRKIDEEKRMQKIE